MNSPFADLINYSDEPPIADVIAELYDHPHFRLSGCRLTLDVSARGLVYCGDCASQVGRVPLELAGLHVGPRGLADRWLHHDAIMAAWLDGMPKEERTKMQPPAKVKPLQGVL